MENNIKIITNCWIYQKYPGYKDSMIDAVMTGDRINTNTQEFTEDVCLLLKRSAAPTYLMKILTSKNTILYIPKEPIARPLKVFCAKDARMKGSDIKVFIDASNTIMKNQNTNRYKCNLDVLIAYLLAAKTNMVYYKIPGAFTKNGDYVAKASRLYAKLFTHIIDYLGNISVVPENRNKMMYIASKYFLHNVLLIDNVERVSEISAKAADITSTEANILNMTIGDMRDMSIKEMVELSGKFFKIDKLTASVFYSKWLYLYGASTVFGVEFFPSFVTMITDAYNGSYMNNQKTIEKVLGKEMVEFGKLNIFNNNGIM